MKPWIAYALLACGLIVSIFVILFGRDIVGMVVVFHDWDKRMEVGKKYMDSLTDQDIQAWIQRTQKYLVEPPTNLYADLGPFPPDLKKLGIVRIDLLPNQIDYVWMGGMDHTELEVERKNDGRFQFTAMYNDESNRMIWTGMPEVSNLQTNSIR